MWSGGRILSPSLTGIRTSGGIGTCFRVDLVPTLAADAGLDGTAGSSLGAGTGCQSFGGESSGDGIHLR
jgi:hypothetical protein